MSDQPFRPIRRGAVLLLLAAAAVPGATWPASAQPARAPATRAAPVPAASAPPAPAAAAAAVPSDPQRTTASFGDWVLRCERPTPAAAPVCEVAQAVATPQGQTVAQIAIGRPAHGEPLRLTLLVPPSVTLTAAPRLLATEPGKEPAADAPALDLTWRRCLPGGCLADATLSNAALARLRARTEPSRVVFQDGAGRDGALPFSPQGLPQALDVLAREDAREVAREDAR